MNKIRTGDKNLATFDYKQIERVLELKRLGDIGDVNHQHFSFMGHITNQHVHTLMRNTAPQVVSALKADGVDIVILTPA